MRILVVNSGSSSLKFGVFNVDSCQGDPGQAEVRGLVTGHLRDIGEQARLKIFEEGSPLSGESQRSISDHAEAFQWMLERLTGSISLKSIEAVGHRVVHGGDRFHAPVRLDNAVLAELDALNDLAPLHNPACLEGIRAARATLGTELPMAAVFDTAFHRTMPAKASTYALPADLAARHRIQRYGFHGIAHASLAEQYARLANRELSGTRLISFQLGNGCSVTAIRDGHSVDTSMGFTPLEGLVMGTRSGDLDPAIVSYLGRREQVSADTVEHWLNERSGLLGLSGLSNNMDRVLAAAHDHPDGPAALAVEVFCYRARKYLGAYLAVLGGADAVLFGGGIGEHAASIRAHICRGMEWCGLELDPSRNPAATDLKAGQGARISADHAGIETYVIAVDEESWIARETTRCIL